jgi:hypothetical protein
MNPASSTSLRKLRLPAYLAAAFLFLYPVIDTFIPAMPVHMGNPQWRYTLVLSMAGTIINPVLAMLVLLGVAIASEDRIATIIVSSLSAVAALLLIVGTAMFGLDAIQLRSAVSPAAEPRYAMMSLWVLIRFASAMVTMVIVAVAAIGAIRRQATAAAQSNGRGAMLVGAARRPSEADIAKPDVQTARMSSAPQN